MSDETRVQRLIAVKAEFKSLIDFHEKSFEQIDNKAKYWLTFTLPAFIAIMGFLFNQSSSMPLALFIASCSLATCLFVSTFLFSSVLVSRRVESGILAPESRKISDVEWYLQSDDRWAELQRDQAAEMLRSIKNNERQNQLKAGNMRRGELSLLRGSPTAICLAGGSALIYAAAGPGGFAAAVAGIGTSGTATGLAAVAGVAIGAGTQAALIFHHHLFQKM